MESNRPTPQVINPRTGDKHAAEDILNDLCQVMRKYGYGLIFDKQRGVMTLSRLDPMGHAFPIAWIERLVPNGATWREIDWTPKSAKPNA